MSTSGGEGQLAVVPDKVRDVGNYVFGLAETLRQALDTATREVDACAGASWTGDYANTFASGWAETRTGGLDIIAALTEMAEKLGVTADTYSRTEDTNAAALAAYSLNM